MVGLLTASFSARPVMTRVLSAFVWALFCVCQIAEAQSPPPLTVLRTSPQGEIASIEEALNRIDS